MAEQFSAADITAAPGVYSASDIQPIGQQPASLAGAGEVMGDQAKRAIGAAWDTISSLPGLVMHPLDALQKAHAYTTDAIKRLREADNPKDAVMSAIGSVPLVGPAGEQIAREIDAGQYPEAIGHAAALRLLAEAPGAIGEKASAITKVVTDPAVVREGVKIIPKGAQAINFYDAIQKARGKGPEASGQAPAAAADAPAPEAPSVPDLQPIYDQVAKKNFGVKYADASPGIQDFIRRAVAKDQAAAAPSMPVGAPAPQPQAAPAPLPESRQLPAAPAPAIVTPAPPDPSGITVTSAARHIFRDPTTGRMSFYYGSEPTSGKPVYDASPTPVQGPGASGQAPVADTPAATPPQTPQAPAASADDLQAARIRTIVAAGKQPGQTIGEFMNSIPPEMRLEAARANFRAMKEGAPAATANTVYDAAHAANASDRLSQLLSSENVPADTAAKLDASHAWWGEAAKKAKVSLPKDSAARAKLISDTLSKLRATEEPPAGNALASAMQ